MTRTDIEAFTRIFFGACVLLLLMGVAGCRSTPTVSTPAKFNNSLPFNPPLAIAHGPFLQAPSETGMTISWGTTRKCVSRVEYRLESSTNWLAKIPAHHGLIDANVTYQNVRLSDLRPGTRYVYRVVSRGIASFKAARATLGGTVISAEYRFTTLDTRKPATSFVVINDRHEKVEPLAASLSSVTWSNVDLAFLNGDMVHAVEGEEQLFRCVVDPCTEAFATQIPLVYARGNHDTRGGFARRLMDYFPTESGRYYYTLEQGPVSFLVLDCGEDKRDDNVEYAGLADFEPYMRQQAEWLARAVEEPAFQKARFRVCLIHLPPFKKPDPKFVRPQWLMDNVVPQLNRGKVDLLICAHTHKYATFPAGTNSLEFPMIIGGTETVIRCDVTADRIRVHTTDFSGKALPQLPPVKARARD